MRTISCILSLLIHALVLLLVLYFPEIGKNTPVDLDKPVYEVNLVKYREKESKEPGEEEKTPEKTSASKKEVQKESAKVPEEETEKKSEPKDKPEKRDIPSAPASKKEVQKESAKVPEEETEKKSEPKDKPEKKDIPRKAAEKSPDREKPQKSTPSPEEIMSDAISAVQKDIQQQEEQDRELLTRELAELKRESEQKGGKNTNPAGELGYSRGIYARILEAKIKQNWSYPVFESKDNLRAEVKIFLDKKGNIINSRIVKESGNKKFDNSVLRAIDITSQLPAPPKEDLKKIGITFNLQENRS